MIFNPHAFPFHLQMPAVLARGHSWACCGAFEVLIGAPLLTLLSFVIFFLALWPEITEIWTGQMTPRNRFSGKGGSISCFVFAFLNESLCFVYCCLNESLWLVLCVVVSGGCLNHYHMLYMGGDHDEEWMTWYWYWYCLYTSIHFMEPDLWDFPSRFMAPV